MCVDINYLDCEKAFDSVPLHRLLTKLKAVGIEGGTLEWIKNFLRERYHRVKVSNASSDWLSVISKRSPSGVTVGASTAPHLNK